MMSHISKGDVHALLDGALGAYPEEAARHIRKHLDGCRECAQLLEGERRLRDEATAILEASAPGPVELEPLEGLLARAAAVDGPRPAVGAERSERTVRARPTLGSRMYSLRWAATVVVSLGAGWMARDLSRPAGEVEPRSVSESVVTEIGGGRSADQPRMERDNVRGLNEAEAPLESTSAAAAGLAEAEPPPESQEAVAAEQDAVVAEVFGGDGDQVEALSVRQRAQSAVAQGLGPAEVRVSGQPAERRVEPATFSDVLPGSALALDQRDAASQDADATPGPPAAPGSLATLSLSTIPFLVPGLPVREVRLALEGDGLAGGAAGSVVVTQELGDGRLIELEFVPLAGSDGVLREAFQERYEFRTRTPPADWGRAVRDVPGGLAVLSGPLTDGELAELLDRALGPR